MFRTAVFYLADFLGCRKPTSENVNIKSLVMIRKIVITLAATIAFAAGAAAQNLTVTGSVTDQEGFS